MYLDYEWLDFVDVRVVGAARDEFTDADGATRVADESSVRLETKGGLLTGADVDPPRFDTAALIGIPLRSGFRRALRSVFALDGGPLGLLLDDAPGGLIAAGYVHAMAGSTDPNSSAGRAARVARPEGLEGPEAMGLRADLCAGWRADGTMMLSVAAGDALPFLGTPPVPQHPEGADGWPAVDIPSPGLRRHRRIDAVPDGDTWLIDAWFRDTYRAAEGECGALHEYTVNVEVDARDQTIRAITAIPHALPWDECPAAADAVGKLAGLPLEGLRSSVPRSLIGVESCTHLTNELRELSDVPRMVAAL
jgi:Protein of unknown function (DUF2889)